MKGIRGALGAEIQRLRMTNQTHRCTQRTRPIHVAKRTTETARSVVYAVLESERDGETEPVAHQIIWFTSEVE